jgi:hypothetical protein
MDPVTLGLCSQIDLDLEVERAARNRPVVESDSTLLPASATENFDYRDEKPEEEELDADKVFAKLSSLKGSNTDEDEE